MLIEFTCNGKEITVDVPAEMRALDLIRDELGLTGTKCGCSKGECGACTILVDGQPQCSCLLLAPKLQDKQITTIEGLTGENGKLHPIQEAFLEEGAVQCGFCTPGMILSTKALLDNNSSPTVSEIEEALSGNICRCTGYAKIIKAVLSAAQKMKGAVL
jgi:aerobic carbon-monoxide dehydrogenase small subunit